MKKHLSSDLFSSSARRGGGLSLATPARAESGYGELNAYLPDNLIALAAAVIRRAVWDAKSKNPARAESARGWLVDEGTAWVDALGVDGEAFREWIEELQKAKGIRE